NELPTIYSKKELVKIIEEHEDANMSDVDEDEERIIKGALTFSDKKVEAVMTPRNVVVSFAGTQTINSDFITRVMQEGHSRYPVYNADKDNVVGILYSKHLLGDTMLGKQVRDVMLQDVQEVSEEESLDDVLDTFLHTHKHIAIVKDEFGGVSGVITLEDVIEEILKKEIIDESDIHDDMRIYAKESAK
ncbi:MAG: CBS domain-containing protein, partial [Candidatus Pacebacteria bacterium]|nr:CBS domain-containing protein [Candidatus Paceibacterota bacterium]